LRDFEAANAVDDFHHLPLDRPYGRETALDAREDCGGLLLHNLIYPFALCAALEALTREPRNLVPMPRYWVFDRAEWKL
jgi:hypothetical protein